MEARKVSIIEGGKARAMEAIDRAYDRNMSLPLGAVNKISDRLNGLIFNPAFTNFHSVFEGPLQDLVTMTWGVKEREQVALGRLGRHIFSEGIPRGRETVSQQISTKKRLEKKFKISLDQLDLGELRKLALITLDQCEEALRSWRRNYSPMFDEDDDNGLMVKMLAEELPLFWQSVLQLNQVVGNLFDAVEKLQNRLRFSLEMIGSPVDVNQEIVHKTMILLFMAVRSLKILVFDPIIGRGLSGRASLEMVLDRAYVYPDYHDHLHKIREQASLHVGLLQLRDFKRFGLENLYNEAERFWSRQAGHVEKENMPGTKEMIEGKIELARPLLSLCFSVRLLGLVRMALDEDLVEEAENLMRVYKFAHNQISLSEHHIVDANFKDWKRLEIEIQTQMRATRRSAFRLIK